MYIQIYITYIYPYIYITHSDLKDASLPFPSFFSLPDSQKGCLGEKMTT